MGASSVWRRAGVFLQMPKPLSCYLVSHWFARWMSKLIFLKLLIAMFFSCFLSFLIIYLFIFVYLFVCYTYCHVSCHLKMKIGNKNICKRTKPIKHKKTHKNYKCVYTFTCFFSCNITIFAIPHVPPWIQMAYAKTAIGFTCLYCCRAFA